MARNDDEKEPYNPPPSPYVGGLSDAEFKKRRKAWNEYTRDYQNREDARKARLDAKKTPAQRAKEAEDEAVKSTRLWSLDQSVQDMTGMTVDEVRQALDEASNLSVGEQAALDAIKAVDRAWTRAGRERRQRYAAKKIKQNKSKIKQRKKGKCAVVAIFILGVSVVELSAFVQGARDLASSLGWA